VPLVSYWDGPVKWLERLCVRSMRDAGHPVILFGHDVAALEREGLGASEIHDAREILADDHPANRYREAGAFQHFADVFRLELLRRGRGVWTDMDCLMLKPIAPKEGYLFGRFNGDTLNNAVLMLPQGSAVLDAYEAAPDVMRRRLYLDTVEGVMSRAHKVLIDKGSANGNLLYLPLDKILEHSNTRDTGPSSNTAEPSVRISPEPETVTVDGRARVER